MGGEKVHLTPIEYKLLVELLKNIGKGLTNNFLLKKVWQDFLQTNIPNLRVIMATLRKKVEDDPSNPKYIQTHIRVGYRMLSYENDSKCDG